LFIVRGISQPERGADLCSDERAYIAARVMPADDAQHDRGAPVGKQRSRVVRRTGAGGVLELVPSVRLSAADLG
jgi:hypothetical protein